MLPRMTSSTSVIDLVADILMRRTEGATDDRRFRLLETLAFTDLPEVPEAWSRAVRVMLFDPNPALRTQAVQTVAAWKLPQVESQLVKLARDERQPPDLRIASLRELTRRDLTLTEPDLRYLNRQLARTNASPVRLAAAETMLAARLSAGQWERFLKSLHGDRLIPPLSVLSTMERQGLLAEHAPALLEYLGGCLDAGWSLPADTIENIRKHLSVEHQTAAKDLLDRLAEMTAKHKQMIDDMAPLLQGGDRHRGQALFFSKSNCFTCHRVYSQGGIIGPDLTKIGAIRAGRDLLESIILPSATIAQGYDQLVVTLKNGDLLTGVRVGKRDDPLTLRDAGGEETRYRKQDIESIERSTMSLMPEELLQVLTKDETRDLLAFLQGLK